MTLEEDASEIESNLRQQEEVPEEATTVAISLDGVMTPMMDGERQQKREDGALRAASADFDRLILGMTGTADGDGFNFLTFSFGGSEEES